MQKFISCFPVYFLICFPIYLRAQLIVSGTAKDAGCNALGEVTLMVTGGNGNYSYQITNNTCSENLPLSQNTNVFKGLSSCAYTFEVTDTDGKFGFVTIAVGGNYLTPLVTAAVDGCTISVNATRGQPPYKYEISKNGGVTWQVNSIPNWTKMANSNYLIRVTDACNVSRLLLVSVSQDPITYITAMGYPLGSSSKDSFYIYDIHGVQGPYTTLLVQGNDTIVSQNGRFSWRDLQPKSCDKSKIIIRHACGDDVQRLKLSLYSLDCISFADGSIDIKPLYGVPPYSFTGYDQSETAKTSSSGLFTDFIKNSSFLETKGKDACGDFFYIQNLKSELRIRPEFLFKTKNDCAALNTATLEISHSTEEVFVDDPDFYTIECTTCMPAAAYKLKSREKITINNLVPGSNTILIKDTCGSVWTCKSNIVLTQFIGCDSASFRLTNSLICDNRPDQGYSTTGDTITNTTYILKNAIGEIIASNTNGEFGRLSTGNYSMDATANGCPVQHSAFTIATSKVDIKLNVGLNRNKNIQFGKDCVTAYTLNVETTYEPYELRDSAGKNMGEGNRFENASLTWFDLPTGRYTIKSLLNCTVREFELPDIKPTLKVVELKNCPEGGTITLSGGKNWLEWKTLFNRDYNLNLFYYRNPADWYDIKSNSDYNLDTATYTYFNISPKQFHTFYLYSAFSDFGITSACPLDSVTINMPEYVRPEMMTNTSFICDQDNRGLVQFRIRNGTRPYSIQQTDASFTTSIGTPVVTSDTLIDYIGLPRGKYYFKLTDACGQTASAQGILTNLDSIKAVKNCDGSLILSFNPVPAARYIWKEGNNVIGDSAILRIPNPKNGTSYHLHFSYNNCQMDRGYILNTNDLSSFSSSIVSSKSSNTLCEGDTITLTAEFIGSLPTSILWNTGAVTASIRVNRIGDYSFQARNASNCTGNASIRILGSDKINAVIAKKDITCFGRSDGSINSSITGGTAPWSYLWSNGSEDPGIQNVLPGIYTLKVTDAIGCSSSVTTQISEPVVLTLNPTLKNQSCAGLNDGSIMLHVDGGTRPYGYEWNNMNNTEIITGLWANTYSVRVTDAQGCIRADSFLITSPERLGAIRYDTICQGDSIRIAGKYLNKAGDYAMLLPATVGCDTLLTAHLTMYPRVDFTVTKADITCFDKNDGIIRIENLITDGPYRYFINALQVADPVVNNLTQGNYKIKVIDTHGCETEKNTTITNPEKVTVDLGKDTTMRFGDSLRIRFNTNVDPTEISRITYMLNNKSPCIGCAEFTFRPTLNSKVMLEMETVYGCIVEDEKSIYLNPTYRIFTPNVLSLFPQQDLRKNHAFTVYGGSELTQIIYLHIFNRWGDQVFEALHVPPNDPGYGWDGTFKGTDALPGVYLYDVKIEFGDRSTKSYHGDITVVR